MIEVVQITRDLLGCPASQPIAPSVGLQARLSPSFLSRMRGVALLRAVGPLDVTEGALVATPPKVAPMASAINAVLMGISPDEGVFASR